MPLQPSRPEKLFSFLPPRWARLASFLLRFALTSFLATVIDFGIFWLLTHESSMSLRVAQVISASVGMTTNFFMQRFFVFDLKRKVHHAFLISMSVSVGGLLLGYLMMSGLQQIPWFTEDKLHKLVAKFIVTAILFFYNIILKRFAFERRFTGSGGANPPNTPAN